MLGLTPSGVRMLVARGKLRPVRRGARPLRFLRADVVELQRARRDEAWNAEVDDTYAEYDAELASQVRGV